MNLFKCLCVSASVICNLATVVLRSNSKYSLLVAAQASDCSSDDGNIHLPNIIFVSFFEFGN